MTVNLSDMELQNKDTNEKNETQQDKSPSKETLLYHEVMASVLDILYPFYIEKKMQSFAQLHTENSCFQIVRLAQTLSCFTDTGVWADPQTRYKAFVISCLRRQLTYGCYRDYAFAKGMLVELVSVMEQVGLSGILQMMKEVREMFQESSEYDMTWLNKCLVEELLRYLEAKKEGREIGLFAEFTEMVKETLEEECVSKSELFLDLERYEEIAKDSNHTQE